MKRRLTGALVIIGLVATACSSSVATQAPATQAPGTQVPAGLRYGLDEEIPDIGA